MSKNRNLVILAVVLVALLAISLLQKVGRQRTLSRPADATVLADGIHRDALRRIEISHGNDAPVILVDGPAGWEVASRFHHPASAERVSTLLTDLENLKGEFRSDAADVLPDYGLTDSTAVVIRGYAGDPGAAPATADAPAASDAAATAAPAPAANAAEAGGEPLFALQIGNRPRGGTGNFVRLPGRTEVYLSRAGILNDLGLYSGPAAPDAKQFLALDAFKVERDDVDAIRLYEGDKVTLALRKEFPEPAKPAAPAAADSAQAGDATMAATDQAPDRQTYEWQLTAPQQKPALKTKADAVLGALVSIRAADVADPNADLATYGLDRPERRVVVVTKDGGEKTLLIGAQRAEQPGAPGGTYFKLADQPQVYVIRQYQVDNIFKTPKDVLPEK